MYPNPFTLERFFARHEFSARHLLSTSDCQGVAMSDLVAGAGPDLRARWDGLRLGYTESQGLPELRAEIATLYETVGPDEVLVAAPEEAIFLLMNALLKPGDHVICTFPGYQSLYELARTIGCEVDLWKPVEGVAGPDETGENDERLWWFDPVELEGLLRPDTKLVVWNFPHNPTGALPSRDDSARMLAAAKAVGAWVFSDEMYRLLEPSDEVRLPAGVDRYERAVSLSGMSKAFGLAGLRLGWVATHDEPLLERMKALKDYTTICSSAPSEILAFMGLRSRETILAANRELVRRNKEAAGAFFARHASVLNWIPPQAGTVCFPRLEEDHATRHAKRHAAGDAGHVSRHPADHAGLDGGTGKGAAAFCARALRDTGVLLLPSTVYDFGDEHFRMGLGREDFETGLAVLDAHLAESGAG
ncbi:MAG: aminotransferase class I/II-fold pyridoxal phosphate-dependent enzyme [Thermoleophilia bacterium]|nr:aminotransferase class I/II-fold pyridoxal phosphate-dependent enzyme [Thermoleophilia bacterium]